jgi:hypothetical protein
VTRRVLAAALAGMLCWSLAACGRDLPASLQVGTSTFAPGQGGPAADQQHHLDGQPYRSSSLREGRVLNAWRPGAGLQGRGAALVGLASARPDMATVVGLNVSDDARRAAFAAEYQMPYPSIEDPKGAILPTIPGVPPAALPSTVVIDQRGRIAARIIGAANEAELARIVDSVAAEQPPG